MAKNVRWPVASIAFLCILAGVPGFSQGAGCRDDRCRVDKVILNTGFNQATGTTYTPVQPDGYWELVDAPNEDSATDSDDLPDAPGTTTTLTLPSPAWVISPNSAWTTPAGTQWISAYNTNALDTNNPPPANSGDPFYAPYSFQRCFCTCEGIESVLLDFKVLVDNTAEITFDGVTLGSLPNDVPSNFNVGLHIKKEVPVQPGRHCLRIDVRNRSKVAMGLNVSGTATSNPPGRPLFLSAACCAPAGKIIGRKFNDLNCNGKDDNTTANQSIEPGLQGWTITLQNTATGATVTATTDSNGFYYFNNLPPGTYTVSETPQPGWSQTVPGSPGTYTVTVGPGDVVQRNFGNCRKPCAQVEPKEKGISCNRNGSKGYTYTFSVTNNSGGPVTEILLTPPAGSTFTLSQQTFNTALANGQSTTLSVDIGNAKPGEKVCFYVTLMSKEGGCCTVETCVVVPECCAVVTVQDIKCNPNGSYTYVLSIVNTSPMTVQHIYLHPPAGVTMTPTYFAVMLAPGATFTTPPITSSGTPDGTLCLRVTLHSERMKECCSVELCIKLPRCR